MRSRTCLGGWLLTVTMLWTSAVLGGEITLFEHPDFGGRHMTVRGEVTNFDRTRFNDRAESIVVVDGFWEVCSDAYFRGECTRIGPGEYRQLGRVLRDSISSVREVGDRGRPTVYAQPTTPERGGAPRIELFEHREFGGRSIVLDRNNSDFERIGFNDRADAAVVYGGVWRLCTDAGMQGNCRDFGPGRYNDLGPLGGRVSSAAIVADRQAIAPPPPPPPRYGGARAVLYERPGFAGRSLPIEGNVLANFDRTDFNDRAESLRVEGGYWVFCTDAHFEGTCRTFGPGEYPTLPWDVDRKISSGRRISEDYPYNGPPSWTR